MEKRYGALRAVGTIYKVLGIVAAAVTVLAVISLCASSFYGGAALDSMNRQFGRGVVGGGLFGGVVGALVLSLAVILYGGVIALTLYAFGETIYLLIALEENTRITAQALQAQKGTGH